VSKPTRAELAKNLLRCRWLLRQFEGQFDSIYPIFIDGALNRYYGKEQVSKWLALTREEVVRLPE
jgi:hypothetical protein